MLIDANKTDLTDEMTKARAAGADVVTPWPSATGLCAPILNTRVTREGTLLERVYLGSHQAASGA